MYVSNSGQWERSFCVYWSAVVANQTFFANWTFFAILFRDLATHCIRA
eukprot:COSAG02_NODE_591_length_19862_cov_8.047918_25_plen_48_part_00